MKTLTEHEKMLITKYDLLFESRLTKVETTITNLEKDIKDIKIDMRWLIGIMLGGFAGCFGFMAALFGLMAHGFKWF